MAFEQEPTSYVLEDISAFKHQSTSLTLRENYYSDSKIAQTDTNDNNKQNSRQLLI